MIISHFKDEELTRFAILNMNQMGKNDRIVKREVLNLKGK